MNAALAIIAFFFVVAVALGLFARRGREMNLEQWSLGGRGFGAIFVFLLMAGEIYTTFTFLGGSGWAYGRGHRRSTSSGYGTSPTACRTSCCQPSGATRGAAARLAGRLLRARSTTAPRSASWSPGECRGVVPYLVLQLKGLGIIVSEASYGSISTVRRGLDGRRRARRVYVVALRRARLGVDRRAQGHHDLRRCRVRRYLPPDPLLRELCGDVRHIEAAKPSFLSLPARQQHQRGSSRRCC